MDTTGDGVADHRLVDVAPHLHSEEVTVDCLGTSYSGRCCGVVRTISQVLSFTIISTLAMAWLEQIPLALAFNTVVNALYSNGDGRYAVTLPISRVLLMVVMLVGFFKFVSAVSSIAMPAMLGAPESPHSPRHVLLPHSPSEDEEEEAAETEKEKDEAARDSTLSISQRALDYERGDRARASTVSGSATTQQKHVRFLRVQTRFKRVAHGFCFWMILNTTMAVAYLVDQRITGASDEIDFQTVSKAALFAVSTSCSGGFETLSNDWLGAIFISIAIPATAYFAAELSAYCKLTRQ